MDNPGKKLPKPSSETSRAINNLSVNNSKTTLNNPANNPASNNSQVLITKATDNNNSSSNTYQTQNSQKKVSAQTNPPQPATSSITYVRSAEISQSPSKTIQNQQINNAAKAKSTTGVSFVDETDPDKVETTYRLSTLNYFLDESTRPFRISENSTCYQNVCNCFLMLSCDVVFGLLVLYFELFMDPPKIGYFCDDNSIRYPMKSETISNTVLVWVVCVMPIFYIAVIELYRQLKMATPKDSCVTVSTQVFGRLMKIYGAYMFGIGFTQLCMDVSKYLLGWLRPHFLDACKPRVDPCKLLLPEELHTLVTNYECTGDPKVVKEARLTFPSGHAAHSFYTAIFLTIFLQYRLPRKKLRLPIHLVQAVLLLAAYSCALTRLHDNMHHFRDMVAGIVTGTVVALLTINYVSDMKNIAKHGMDQHSLISMRTSSFHTHHV